MGMRKRDENTSTDLVILPSKSVQKKYVEFCYESGTKTRAGNQNRSNIVHINPRKH